MAGIKVSKNVILPRLDRIKDTEMKKTLEQLFKVIQDMNSNNYNDLTYLEDRIYTLEHP
jgi:hypothetical protein